MPLRLTGHPLDAARARCVIDLAGGFGIRGDLPSEIVVPSPSCWQFKPEP